MKERWARTFTEGSPKSGTDGLNGISRNHLNNKNRGRRKNGKKFGKERPSCIKGPRTQSDATERQSRGNGDRPRDGGMEPFGSTKKGEKGGNPIPRGKNPCKPGKKLAKIETLPRKRNKIRLFIQGRAITLSVDISKSSFAGDESSAASEEGEDQNSTWKFGLGEGGT